MGRKQLEMTAEQEQALDQAEARLREAENTAAQLLAEARAEVARAMLAAGPSAVARRDGLTRQAVHFYIQRYGTPMTERKVPRPSRREALLELPADEAERRRKERDQRRSLAQAEGLVREAEDRLKAARKSLDQAIKSN